MDGNDSSEPQNAEPPGYPSSAASPAGSTLTDPGGAATDEFKQLMDNISKSAGDIDDMRPGTDELVSAATSTPGSETNATTSDQGSGVSKTTSTTGTMKSAPAAKRSFKPQSLNGIFRQLQATSVAVKSSAEKSTTSSIPHQSSQTNLNAARLRMTPKLSTSTGAFTLAPLRRDLSISPRPGSASGSGPGTRTSTQPVWNKGQVQPAGPKAHKEFSEEELKKLGIHLTESIATDGKETKWADDDDDDDWGDTIEFGDGTKVVLSHDHESPRLDIEDELRKAVQLEEQRQAELAPPTQTSNESSHQPATKPPTHSPWAPIPHIQPASLLTKISDTDKSESHDSIQSRDGSNISRQEEPGRQNYQHYGRGHDLPPYGSQDVRNQVEPIVLPRDRFSDMDFDRSYGPRSSGQGGELFNDRSGQMESVRRRSFNSRRPPPPQQQKVMGIMSRTGRQEIVRDDRDPMARRGSSSVSSGGRRRLSLSRRSEDEVSIASGISPSDDQGSQPRSAGQSPSMAFTQMHHNESDNEVGRRPSHITAQQEVIMKHSIENARKRKEEEQKHEQERLEAARKRAEEVVRKKQQEQEQRQQHQQEQEQEQEQQEQQQEKEDEEREEDQAPQVLARHQEQGQPTAPLPEKPRESLEPERVIEHNEHVAVPGSEAVKQVDSPESTVTHDAAKSRRKESSASSDGAEGMDASVTAAIEFLISEPAAGQSPPVPRAITKPTAPVGGAPGSGWDNTRVMGRDGSWNRNGLNDGSRGPPYVRSLVNGNDNVWGPVGSRSRYPAIDGVGNGVVDSRSFLSGTSNVPNGPAADWVAKPHTPAQLSENWRRPFAPQKDTTGRTAASSAPVGSSPGSSSSAVRAPVGTPIPSPVKGGGSVGQSSPSSSLSYEANKPNDDGLGLSGTGVPSASSASSSRLLSRFFPSGMPQRVDAIGEQLSLSTGMGTTGLSTDSKRYMTESDDDRVLDNYLSLSQSVHNLSDDSSSLRPKVHLPPVSPTVRFPPAEPDTRSNGVSYGGPTYSPEGAEGTQQFAGHILSGATVVVVDNGSGGSVAGGGLGYVGGKIPSIGAIEAVQSRIAMTLGAHNESAKLRGSKQQSPTSSPVMSQQQMLVSPIRKPTTILLPPPKLSVTSAEQVEVACADEGTTQYKINLAEYPQTYTVFRPKRSMLDSFQVTKKIPGNFVGAISAAVSSASPASNPFNPQRRGGGSSAYKIMLPGLHEHILIPVNTTGATTGGSSGYHYSSRRAGESREWSRRGTGGQSKHS
ncbi:hypothetical protein V1509DRAFT_652166 [Lipomyces kononenkoae]